MDPITKEKLIAVVISDSRAKLLDEFCREMFNLGLVELLDFRETYGEFAATMLIHHRLTQQHKDPMREAVEELYKDEKFMDGIPEHIKQMVGQALYGPAH